MSKIPFDIVCIQVEELYNKSLSLEDPKHIDEFCNYVEEFIKACGWSVEEYNQKFMTERSAN